jgi:hypothetical protein
VAAATAAGSRTGTPSGDRNEPLLARYAEQSPSWSRREVADLGRKGLGILIGVDSIASAAGSRRRPGATAAGMA